jgi:hypothetical protein
MAVAVERGRRGWTDLQAIAVSSNEGAAANMPLNQPLRLKFGIGVCNRSAMNAKYGRQFAARRDTVAGPQVTRMNEGAQLIAKLNVKRNMAFGLKV